MTKQANLRAMQRLLGYAVIESQTLDLPQLERLLGAAALAVDDALARGKAQATVAARSQHSPGLAALR
jgi:hypothetical protein